MPSRNTTPPPKDHTTPDHQPANKVLRRPEPNVIDQRQQQIDPAGLHRADINAPASDTMKQPGGAGHEGRDGSTSDRAARQRQQPSLDRNGVRQAGRREMRNPPPDWDQTDERADESFPASDPPGTY